MDQYSREFIAEKARGCAPRISGSYARHDDLTTNLAWRTRSPSSGLR